MVVSTHGIHSSLSANSYEVTKDSGLTFDERQVYAERSQTVVFRGSLQQLFAKFRFGQATQVPDAFQTRMYCAGPRSARMIDGTEAQPHWEAQVSWIGLHSYVHGPSQYIWRLTPLWTEQETHLPTKYSNLLGSEYTLRAGGPPYVPADADFGADHACVIHDHVPGYQIEGVMVSSAAPYPSHPHILAILGTLGVPNSADMVNYGENTFAGYNWSKRMPANSGHSLSDGVWFPGSIQSSRIIEPMYGGTTEDKIYQVSFPVRWIPRKAPV